MNTSKIFAEAFIARTTGPRRTFTVVNLTLDAVKTVLKGTLLKQDTVGAIEDCENGYLRRVTNSGFHGGNDGYAPTAKGFRRILAELQ